MSFPSPHACAPLESCLFDFTFALMPPWYAHLALRGIGNLLFPRHTGCCAPLSPHKIILLFVFLPFFALQHKPNPEFQGAVASGVPEQHSAHDELEDTQTHHDHRYAPPTRRQSSCHRWRTLFDANPLLPTNPSISFHPKPIHPSLFSTFLCRLLFSPQLSIREPSTSQQSRWRNTVHTNHVPQPSRTAYCSAPKHPRSQLFQVPTPSLTRPCPSPQGTTSKHTSGRIIWTWQSRRACQCDLLRWAKGSTQDP
jgi:hypothetical protein